MPEVTVITAVRNGRHHLSDTVASVLRQTFEDFEYLIIDDASSDGTSELVSEWSRRDRRLVLIRRTSPGGPFAAANDALQVAKGRYIVRTDGDDISTPTRIARQLEFLRSSPTARACATFARHIDDTGRLLSDCNRPPVLPRVLTWYLCLRCPLVHSSACIEREALLELGGYRVEQASQDARLWCEVSRAGWLAVLPEVLVHFRQHARRISVERATLQRELAIDVMRDHVRALTGDLLSRSDAETLYAVGHAEQHPVTPAMVALERWDQWWHADASVGRAERADLRSLSAFRRRQFLRSNAKSQPLACLRSAAASMCWRPRLSPLRRQ